jgi:hypothetical protein
MAVSVEAMLLARVAEVVAGGMGDVFVCWDEDCCFVLAECAFHDFSFLGRNIVRGACFGFMSSPIRSGFGGEKTQSFGEGWFI